jgi:hypothetical protein
MIGCMPNSDRSVFLKKRIEENRPRGPIKSAAYRQLLVFFGILVLMQVSAPVLRAQGKIVWLGKNLRPATPTTEVTCIRHRTRRREPRVIVSMDLRIGDELIGNSGSVTVKARCGTNTDLVLSGYFRVRFERPDKQGCRVFNYLKPGSQMNVSSFAPTNIDSAEVGIRTVRTAYEIKVGPQQYKVIGSSKKRRVAVKALVQVLAYKDDVQVSVRGGPRRVVREGEKVYPAGKATRVDKIFAEDIARTASVFAALDASQLPAFASQEDRVKAASNLNLLHQNVLEYPNSRANQLLLLHELIHLGIPPNPYMSPLPEATPSPSPYPTAINQATPIVRPTPTPPSTPQPTPQPTPKPTPTQPTKPAPPSEPLVWDVPVNTRAVFPLNLGNSCQKPHKLRAELRGLRFARIIENAETVVAGGGTVLARVQVDATNVKPGTYPGVIQLSCLDCSKEEACRRGQTQVTINILPEKKKQSEIAGPPKPEPAEEQAKLFELIKQGRYEEAIAGFNERLKHKRDSRDAYGVALGYEGLQQIEYAANAARQALSMNEKDGRLSKAEQIDCERITAGSAPVPREKPTGVPQRRPDVKPEVHDLALKPNNKTTITTATQRSTCKSSLTMEVTLENLPFARLPGGAKKIIAPGEWNLEIEIDTTGMKAGKYQGQVLISCLDCKSDPSCVSSWYKIIQINLEVIGEVRGKLSN